jgi:hypothetical protein
VTADVLRDFMLGRLRGADRQRLRDRLAVDPVVRGTLRRLRNSTRLLRTKLGAVEQVPREWIPLIEAIAADTPMRPAARARERTKTWL